MEFLSKSVEDTKRFASEFIEKLLKSSRSHATVVGLYGNLGSGKTTFVQAVAETLVIKDHIVSPTFLIFKKYRLPVTGSSYRFLIHLDAYRLKNSDELRRLRFEELLADPKNLIFVEWTERIADILPSGHQEIYFELVDECTRKINFHST